MEYNKKYLKLIYNCIQKIKNPNNYKIYNGKILELITCIKFNCLMYQDVPKEYKDKYNLPSNDKGIDCIDIKNNILYQVKFFHKSKISQNTISSFLAFKTKDILKDFSYKVITNQNNSYDNIDNVEFIIINDYEIYNYIGLSYLLNYENIIMTNIINDNNILNDENDINDDNIIEINNNENNNNEIKENNENINIKENEIINKDIKDNENNINNELKDMNDIFKILKKEKISLSTIKIICEEQNINKEYINIFYDEIEKNKKQFIIINNKDDLILTKKNNIYYLNMYQIKNKIKEEFKNRIIDIINIMIDNNEYNYNDIKLLQKKYNKKFNENIKLFDFEIMISEFFNIKDNKIILENNELIKNINLNNNFDYNFDNFLLYFYYNLCYLEKKKQKLKYYKDNKKITYKLNNLYEAYLKYCEIKKYSTITKKQFNEYFTNTNNEIKLNFMEYYSRRHIFIMKNNYMELIKQILIEKKILDEQNPLYNFDNKEDINNFQEIIDKKYIINE